MENLLGYFYQPELCERNPRGMHRDRYQRLEKISPSNIGILPTQIIFMPFDLRDTDILYTCHDTEYVRRVENSFANKERYLDRGDTIVTSDVFEQALLSASAGCEAVDAIESGKIHAAFCGVRPSGHHAGISSAMSECIFNNAAVAARYAQHHSRFQKILIIDWDNEPAIGTQQIFIDDPSVCVLSIHQADMFPKDGRSSITGKDEGDGYNFNIPIQPGTQIQQYMFKFMQSLRSVTQKFQPDLVILSAGFNGHYTDSDSKLAIHEQDYAYITKMMFDHVEPFCNGHIISILEGGYYPEALQYCVNNHISTLAECITAPVPVNQ